jgi:hypothetical protein
MTTGGNGMSFRGAFIANFLGTATVVSAFVLQRVLARAVPDATPDAARPLDASTSAAPA